MSGTDSTHALSLEARPLSAGVQQAPANRITKGLWNDSTLLRWQMTPSEGILDRVKDGPGES